MPDLGLYTGEVLAAYAGSLALLAVLVGGSIWQARRTIEMTCNMAATARPYLRCRKVARRLRLIWDNSPISLCSRQAT